MQDIRVQDAGRMSDGSRTDVGRKSEESLRNVGRKSNERLTNIGRKLDESPTNVERAEFSRRCCNGRWQRCTAAPGNATLWRGRQSVATRCYGEAGRALQLVAVARPVVGCSSLLRQWPAVLQLAAMADSVLQCFFFFFNLLDNFKSERERDRKRKGGRAFETCSKIPTLLVGRN
jgi:hypothetical protein